MTKPNRNTDPVSDRRWLDLAARLAWRAAGHAEPNPLVGAVVVRDGEVLGMGHHRVFGDLHAEREAIASCRRQGHDPEGATIYVTLEPCCHHGKQPPCTEAILEAGITTVVHACVDPGEVSKGGAAVLRKAGVEVRHSDASALASGMAAPFVKRVRTGLPWVIAKWAQTIDGRVATRTGESKWISCEASRRRVHMLRSRVDVMLTGIGTVLADDPMLTARNVPVRRVARRVVLDTRLEIPDDAALVRTAREIPTTVLCDAGLATAAIAAPKRATLERAGVEVLGCPASLEGIDVREALALLARHHGTATVMLESGPRLVGAMLRDDLVDEAVIYIAPMLLGDELARSVAVGRVVESLSSGMRLRLWRARRVVEDMELTYRR